MKSSTIKKINNGVILAASIAIYWLVIVVVYVVVSIVTESWNTTWIIWPIATVVLLIIGLVYYSVKRGNFLKKYAFIFKIVGTVILFTATYLLVSFLVQPSIWHISWLIFIVMFIAILIEVIVFVAKKNKILQESEVNE